jgi:hypothetical protein
VIFRLYNRNRNLETLAREIGYKPIGTTEKGELNCVRPLGASYPRFHIYLKETPEIITCNLHLDQKKPSYEGATAHSGDYESDTVRAEVERIKDILFRD